MTLDGKPNSYLTQQLGDVRMYRASHHLTLPHEIMNLRL